MKKSKFIVSMLFMFVVVLTLNACKSETFLAEPKNIFYDETTRSVKWDAVKNASSYHVRINKGVDVINEEDITQTEYSVSYLLTAGYTAFVYAKADGYTNSPLAFVNFIHSKPYEELPLQDKPANFKRTENTFSWDPVASATQGYQFTAQKNDSTYVTEIITQTTYTLPEFTPGAYKIQVHTLGESGVSRPSERSVIEFGIYGKLDTPTDFTVDNLGLIIVHFQNVENAYNYHVTVTFVDTNYEIYNQETMLNQVSINSSLYGDYSITVQALSKYNEYYYDSLVATYVYHNYPSYDIKLNSPGISVDKNETNLHIGFSSGNANFYNLIIELNNGGSNTTLVNTGTTENSYDLILNSVGTYTIKVKASNTKYDFFTDSDVSVETFDYYLTLNEVTGANYDSVTKLYSFTNPDFEYIDHVDIVVKTVYGDVVLTLSGITGSSVLIDSLDPDTYLAYFTCYPKADSDYKVSPTIFWYLRIPTEN